MRLVLTSGARVRKSGGANKWRSLQLTVMRLVCHLLYWIPVQVFLALFLVDRSIYLDTVDWMTAFLFPVNAIVNSFMITIREIIVDTRKNTKTNKK